jgi:hypothetical protein
LWLVVFDKMEQKKIPFQLVWGCVMASVFFIMACLALFTPMLQMYSLTVRIIFGVVLMAYGLMRGHQMYVMGKKQKE